MKSVPPKTILISSIRLIGDVILTTPLISLFREAYPGAAIDVLVADGTGGFLRKDPRVRNVLTAPSKQIKAGQTGDNGFGLLRSIFRRYDLAVTLNASDRGALAVVCAGRRERIGFYEESGFLKNFWKKLLLSKALFYDTSGHVVLHCRQVAESLGITAKRLEVAVYWDDQDRAVVADRLAGREPGSPYVVIHPFARWEYKYWDLDSFVRLSDRLAEEHALVPVWTASPDPRELELLQTYSARCAVPPLCVPGSLTLNQMACLISGAALYVGLDTAVTHIAASTGVPMVALYGPTPAYRWFPWNNSAPAGQLQGIPRGRLRNGSIVVLQESCAHPDCIRPRCQDPCMMRIGMEEVCREAAALLKGEGGGRDV